jgi:hypothetical protein
MQTNHISVEVYKRDRRLRAGERLILKQDHAVEDSTTLRHTYATTYTPAQGYRVEFYDTYVTRRNAMTGLEFQERYDTPWACSPASETYWCS